MHFFFNFTYFFKTRIWNDCSRIGWEWLHSIPYFKQWLPCRKVKKQHKIKITVLCETRIYLLLQCALRVEVWLACRQVSLLSANHTKCPNTIKQFVGYYPTNFLIVSDHFLGLTLEGIVLKTLHLLVRLKLRSIDHIYCGIYWKEYKE